MSIVVRGNIFTGTVDRQLEDMSVFENEIVIFSSCGDTQPHYLINNASPLNLGVDFQSDAEFYHSNDCYFLKFPARKDYNNTAITFVYDSDDSSREEMAILLIQGM